MPYKAYSIFAQLLFISGPLQFKQKFSANLVEDLISEADGEAKILAVRKTMTSGMPSYRFRVMDFEDARGLRGP